MTQIDVVGAVIVRGDTVLAARRGQTKTLPGMWEFPGGKIEKGETPKEALRREIEEELGCRIEVGERVETTSHEYEFGIVTLTTFYATLISEEPMSTEHSEIRWIRATELGTVDWHRPTHRPFCGWSVISRPSPVALPFEEELRTILEDEPKPRGLNKVAKISLRAFW